MIDDPKEIKGYLSNSDLETLKKSGVDHFFYTQRVDDYHHCDIVAMMNVGATNDDNNYLFDFAVVKHDKDTSRSSNIFKKENQYVSREIWIEFMKELHPDHFEWFLFHPEWLR